MRIPTSQKNNDYPAIVASVVLIGLFISLLFIILHDAGPSSGLTPVSSAVSEVPYSTLLKGSSSAFCDRGFYILKNESEFNSLYFKMYHGAPVIPLPPAVDFSKYVVVAVFQGDFQTGGHEIQVCRVVDSGSELKIIVNEVNPNDRAAFTTISNQPFHLVKIPKTNKTISFESKVYKV